MSDHKPNLTQRHDPDAIPTSGQKVGSDLDAAKHTGGKGDFGIPAAEALPNDMREHNPDHPALNDQGDDRRPLPAASPANRTHGVGSRGRGKPGSGSFGDVDTDVIGVGTGGGSLSSTGDIHEAPGPDDTDGSSAAFASGPPAEIDPATPPRGAFGGDIRVHGSTTNPETSAEADADEGQDAAGPQAGPIGDDAAAGELTSDEATGENQW